MICPTSIKRSPFCLDERERELRDMRRRKGGIGPGASFLSISIFCIETDHPASLGDAPESLHAELENARLLIEENVAELERLRDEVDALREEKDDLLDQLDGARLEIEGMHRTQVSSSMGDGGRRCPLTVE